MHMTLFNPLADALFLTPESRRRFVPGVSKGAAAFSGYITSKLTKLGVSLVADKMGQNALLTGTVGKVLGGFLGVMGARMVAQYASRNPDTQHLIETGAWLELLNGLWSEFAVPNMTFLPEGVRDAIGVDYLQPVGGEYPLDMSTVGAGELDYEDSNSPGNMNVIPSQYNEQTLGDYVDGDFGGGVNEAFPSLSAWETVGAWDPAQAHNW